MKKIDKNSLSFKNTVSLSNNNTTNTVNKLKNTAGSEVQYVSSFGDMFLEAIGSNNITKSTAIEILENEDITFIEEDDILEVVKSGSNSEYIKIELKSGERYFFDIDTNELSMYVNSEGKVCNFQNGLASLYKNIDIYDDNGNKEISNITITENNTFVIRLENGASLHYDMKNNNRLTTIVANNKFYSMEELEEGIDIVRNHCIAENQESIKWFTYNNPIPGAVEHYEEENRYLEKCTFENIEKISIQENGYMSIKFKNYDSEHDWLFSLNDNSNLENVSYWASDTNENYYNFNT